jgi:hypothetical protein
MEKLGAQILLASAEFSSNLNDYKQRYVLRIEDLYGLDNSSSRVQ